MMTATRVLFVSICCACMNSSASAAAPSASPSAASSEPQLKFDHVWIVVTRNAPERAALERAGLKISPNVNRHDGQGTASISAEFLNAYIELMWPDPTVSVAQGAERGAEKFKNRMNWRTSGWCPIGIGLHRSGPATPLPFPTWTIAPDWMPKGDGHRNPDRARRYQESVVFHRAAGVSREGRSESQNRQSQSGSDC